LHDYGPCNKSQTSIHNLINIVVASSTRMTVPLFLRRTIAFAGLAAALSFVYPGVGQNLTLDRNEHMEMTAPRPLQPGDQQRADAVVVAARKVMEQYADYRKALTSGYTILAPGVKQRVYHFTLNGDFHANLAHFDLEKPTSLLYVRLPSPGPRYKIVGLMYGAPYDVTEDELNRRIPLSVARWHKHSNICMPPNGLNVDLMHPGSLFGPLGSIVTADACKAAGGNFLPHPIGWVVHVYASETDPSKIWNPSMEMGDPNAMDPMMVM
jgi:hypothetical protein